MDIKKTVGTRINAALARRGMLQKDLAKVLGVTDNTISYYCKGVRGPQLEQLPRIAEALSTTTDYLLGLSDDPSIHPTAADDLQISAKAIQQLRSFSIHERQSAELSLLMEDRLLWSILREVIAYKNATIAEGIYDSIALKHYTSDNDNCMAESIAETRIEEELSKALYDASLDETVRRYLSSLIYLRSLPYDNQEPFDAAYVLNFVPSEMHEQRARNYLSALLERANQENPIHSLRSVFMEVAESGHIHYDQDGNPHYSPKRRKDDE